MAAIMGSYQYHSKRAGPYRHRSSFVGSQWTKSRVHFFYDNMAVVAVLKTLAYSLCTYIMHLLRCLAFYAAESAISRNNLTVIPSLIPQAAPTSNPGTPGPSNPGLGITNLDKVTLTMAPLELEEIHPILLDNEHFPPTNYRFTHRLTSSHISHIISPFQSTGRLLDRTSALCAFFNYEQDYQTQV